LPEINEPGIHKTVLANGVTVISEHIDSVRSIAVGVWVKTGSRGERRSENGIAHFLEHMVFKGTKKRSPLKIAQSLESLGGHLNAFTGKEVTCFFANALDTHLSKTVEILADIVCHSTFPDREIIREKLVVLEEIKSTKDSPEDYVFDLFHEKLFPESSLGKPILGKESIIRDMNRDQIISFWQENYAAKNIIISGAGNLGHDRFVRYIEKYFNFDSDYKYRAPQRVESARGESFLFEQPINQAHLCTGIESISYTSNKRFPLMVLNTYLGGGMSSRLFQQIRERRGLAYSVYSFIDFYSDVGLFGIYAGTDKKKLSVLQKVLQDELSRLSSVPVKSGTLDKIKNQLKGNLLLALESTSRRMSQLAKNEIYFGKYISMDALVEGIDQVSPESILQVAQEVLQPEKFVTVIINPVKQ